MQYLWLHTKMDLLGRCASFSLTPPPNTLGHTLGAPGSGLCLPCRPCTPSPSAHTSPQKCEVISPRQAIAHSPQMFARSAAGSRGPGWALGRLCGAERGHKGRSVPGRARSLRATQGAWPRAGRALLGQPESPPGERLRPCPAPSPPVERRVTAILG